MIATAVGTRNQWQNQTLRPCSCTFSIDVYVQTYIISRMSFHFNADSYSNISHFITAPTADSKYSSFRLQRPSTIRRPARCWRINGATVNRRYCLVPIRAIFARAYATIAITRVRGRWVADLKAINAGNFYISGAAIRRWAKVCIHASVGVDSCWKERWWQQRRPCNQLQLSHRPESPPSHH